MVVVFQNSALQPFLAPETRQGIDESISVGCKVKFGIGHTELNQNSILCRILYIIVHSDYLVLHRAADIPVYIAGAIIFFAI